MKFLFVLVQLGATVVRE